MNYVAAMAALSLVAGSTASAAVIADFDGGIGPVANHPEGSGVSGTWYDITHNAFATPQAGTLDSSPSLQILDGGFTNGVYIIYSGVIPATGVYRLQADMRIIEDPEQLNSIQAYQMGAVVNGTHRGPNPSSLPAVDPLEPGSAIGDYDGLTDGDDSDLPIQLVSTGEFTANAGDNLLVAFSTDLESGGFNADSASWGAGASILVDNLTLVTVIPEPTSLGLLGAGGLCLLRRRR